MSTNIQPPVKGAPLRAQWGVDITDAVNNAGIFSCGSRLVRSGYGGNGYAKPLPNMRETKRPITQVNHPFQVRRIVKPPKNQNDNSTVKYAIFLPDGCVRINNNTVSVATNLEIVKDEESWYYFADAIEKDSILDLKIRRSEEGEISGALTLSAAAGDDPPGVDPNAPAENDASDTLLNAIIARISPTTIAQSVMSAIILNIPVPDNTSIDEKGEEGSLQISHFNDSEKDSQRGLAVYLASILRADPETGEITADGKTSETSGEGSEAPMILARHNGQIIYIPLSAGNGEEPPASEKDNGRCQPHPEGGDAVNPAEDSNKELGGAGVDVGVSPGSEAQTGGGAVQDCCNSKK